MNAKATAVTADELIEYYLPTDDRETPTDKQMQELETIANDLNEQIKKRVKLYNVLTIFEEQQELIDKLSITLQQITNTPDESQIIDFKNKLKQIDGLEYYNKFSIFKYYPLLKGLQDIIKIEPTDRLDFSVMFETIQSNSPRPFIVRPFLLKLYTDYHHHINRVYYYQKLKNKGADHSPNWEYFLLHQNHYSRFFSNTDKKDGNKKKKNSLPIVANKVGLRLKFFLFENNSDDDSDNKKNKSKNKKDKDLVSIATHHVARGIKFKKFAKMIIQDKMAINYTTSSLDGDLKEIIKIENLAKLQEYNNFVEDKILFDNFFQRMDIYKIDESYLQQYYPHIYQEHYNNMLQYEAQQKEWDKQSPAEQEEWNRLIQEDAENLEKEMLHKEKTLPQLVKNLHQKQQTIQK
ncbi:MAG: hypothetical protein DRQ51_04735 [Gammaproteobacteria bacterium]|nr:MAG: hypothetical protein DRQ51_04735 [Gammaproteobacteria bacterium]